MSKTNRIPFLDLVTPHQELRGELVDIFTSALDTAGFIGGPVVETFERQFAAFCDVSECVGVSSGTDALRFALMAAGAGDGDIVVTVPNTFIATTEAISQAGARPVFVDIDERTYNMNPQSLREYLEGECDIDGDTGCLVDRRLGRRVAAVVPVHLYGQSADMDPILELADEYNLLVIEDACQAHGAEYFSQKRQCWKKAGSMGRAAAFSFYPGKNLGACGEAGAVTTNDAELAKKIRMLRDHGQAKKYYHDVEGYNGRLDAIQAGILKVKLQHLAAWNEQRRQSATLYGELLGSTAGVTLPVAPAWSKAVYHLYVIRVEDRAGLQEHLAGADIGTAIHYPVPLHLQKAYGRLGYQAGDFPVAERCAVEIVSLPMFPGLRKKDQIRVADAVQSFVGRAPTGALAASVGSASY
jgi:dTDP-4-amino-4,6-dideoxygalactose transaminase